MSDRVGRGLTLALALAAENNPTVNEETWKKALQAHPEFSPHYEAGKGKFLDRAVQRLSQHDDAKFLCWLLERRHSDLFARPASVDIKVGATASAGASADAGIPADVVQRSREIAAAEQSQAATPKAKPPTKHER
ncbi:MAG TPA: hypothetical protein VHA37_04475 [Candidatus Saccharimonadales bacterium]|nr:hypothetical protein [Candidatus Saccharimonadales bacterium]